MYISILNLILDLIAETTFATVKVLNDFSLLTRQSILEILVVEFID